MFCWGPSSVAEPCCTYMQHYGILYHEKWHQHGKPTTGTSGPVRRALCKTPDNATEMEIHISWIVARPPFQNASVPPCQNCVEKNLPTSMRYNFIVINSQFGPTGSDLHPATSWTFVTRSPYLILLFLRNIKAKKNVQLKKSNEYPCMYQKPITDLVNKVLFAEVV